MKFLLALLIFTLPAFAAKAAETWEKSYDSLLGKYASHRGVRYAAWKANPADLAALAAITDTVAAAKPEKLSRDAQLAFYINAYNAWTLKNVLAAYPIQSIRDVSPLFGFFTRKTITVAGQKMSLNDLEKGIIIKKFREPRIHAAINCASRSCPWLASDAYSAEELSSQLDTAFSSFVNENPFGVKVARNGKTAAISSIFKWYAADFEPKGGALVYIKLFRKDQLNSDLKVTYQDYDWSLNEAK